jgi:hypothetical protein
VPVRNNAWEDLVAAGKVTLAVEDADVADEAPRDYGVDTSQTLAVMRADER